MNYGIRYIVIGIGSPEPESDRATEEDVQNLLTIINERVGHFQARALSERASNKLTLALLQEEGVL